MPILTICHGYRPTPEKGTGHSQSGRQNNFHFQKEIYVKQSLVARTVIGRVWQCFSLMADQNNDYLDTYV